MKKETIITTINWTNGDKPESCGEYLVYGKEIVMNKEVHRVRVMNYGISPESIAYKGWQDERGFTDTGFIIEYYAPATIISPAEHVVEHVCESNRMPSLVRCCKQCGEVIR